MDDPNSLVRKLIESREPGTEAFFFEWEGTRVPRTVTFPDGTELKTGYMRDGILQFDGFYATYERIRDVDNELTKSMVVYYRPR